MRIAVASSGLGHVARGIETWAVATAEALSGAGVQGSGFRGEGNPDVTLFAGAPLGCGLAVRILPCLRRGDRLAQWLARWSPGFTWRWGLKNPYGWEQLSFWLRLWPRLVRERFDILHVQDPMVADWCRRFQRLGLVKTKEILAHGTEEPLEFLARFERLQHLAPWHQQECERQLRERGFGQTVMKDWSAIPNFVDCRRFQPASSTEERRRVRRQLGVPEDALVVGCVAAVKKDHKRVDYLVREIAACRPPVVPFLLLAGARTGQSDELAQLAAQLLPDRHRFILDCPREQMPGLYRAMDVFALPSLFEMMPIALLEAMASGVPCMVNRHPVLEWMIGKGEAQAEARGEHGEGTKAVADFPAGFAIDMGCRGALCEALTALAPEWMAGHGAGARQRAESVFSREKVIGQYAAYYRQVMGSGL